MDRNDSPTPPPDPNPTPPDADASAAPHETPTPPPGTLPRAVPVRPRHDGWTPERQHAFITALAETGCVTEAAAAVGMTARSAYRLRARADANVFRQSWDIALDYAIRNLTDAALGRALHGVARPVFYKGEQVGERRYYDERLTQFLLRYRDPVRYGAWRDSYEARRHPDGAAIVLANALAILIDAGHGVPPPVGRDGVELPLDEGPAPAPAIEPADDSLLATPELRQLRDKLWNTNRQRDDPDDETGDWRDPLTALRPNRPSKFKVP